MSDVPETITREDLEHAIELFHLLPDALLVLESAKTEGGYETLTLTDVLLLRLLGKLHNIEKILEGPADDD